MPTFKIQPDEQLRYKGDLHASGDEVEITQADAKAIPERVIGKPLAVAQEPKKRPSRRKKKADEAKASAPDESTSEDEAAADDDK